MASSSNSEHHRGEQRPARLVRQNSSFIGTIKNIVKLPLNWFANQDDADTTSTPGKRRRQVEQESTEQFIQERDDFSMRDDVRAVDSDDESSRRTKRMRVHSPPQRTSQPYLDPPAAALRRVDPSRKPSIVPRASSAVLPSSRATLSPRRRLPVTRTMSIDPPHHPLVRRESTAFNFGPPPSSAEADYDMAIDTFRDVSMPPSPGRSPRPSFRMRSSVTPQPQQYQPPTRYISEPPPLNTLVSNPIFLHAPAQPVQPSAAPTLGALVESVRATKSPTRQQHGSLFLASSATTINTENTDAPSERALHQLDVYKTPLLPTRMRSTNLPASITATTTPDMFKSRRKSHLVLMQDDKDRLGRKVSGSGKSPVVNQTKPYAGEGGMKKLLARRKQEEEEEDSEFKEKGQEDMDNDITPRPPHSPPPTVRTIPEPPVPTGADWFSTAASTSSAPSGSSLRVGRSTTRNHLARPAKSRFSAKYDEEAEDVEDERAEKRREMAKEAARLVPLFKEPPGFSFSLEAPPMEPTKGDDPTMFPIASLPFSIAKSSAPSSKTSSPKSSTQPLTEKNKETGPVHQISIGVPPAPVRVPTPEPKVAPLPVVSSLVPPSGGGLPNFFANSKLLSEVKLPTPPPVMNFGPTTSASTAGTTSFPFATTTSTSTSKSVNEQENPFWDGSKKYAEVELMAAQNLFAVFGKEDGEALSTSSTTAKPASLFGGATSAFAPIPKSKSEDAPSISSAPQQPFSFGKSAETSSPFGAPPVTTTTEPPKVSFDVPAAAKPVVTETAAPKSLFDATRSTFGDASKTASLGNPFGVPAAPQTTPSPLPFTFGAPAAQPSTAVAAAPAAPAPATASQSLFFSAAATTAPVAEAPKSLFGGPSGGGFSFGQPQAEKKEEAKTPFSFGATPNTPPAAIATPKPLPAPFSFGQSSTTPTATSAVATPSIGFSFSGGGSATSDVSSKPLFSFGQPSAAPIDRSTTPPKIHENEFKMEESPTRDLQQANNKMPESRPTIGGGAFSFGTPSSALSGGLFGGGQTVTSPAPTSSLFSFGSATSNPFAAKENKPEEPKAFGGFGQTAVPTAPSISTSFSFGQTKPAEDASRPSTGGGFTFGPTPTSATAAPGTAFSFGAPAAASNPFGQPAASGSAPSSPSTFNQPSPFAFGAPAPATNGGFSFGSQPASPAAGGNLSLPPSGFGTGGGFGQSQQPSSPFSAPIALAPSTSGGGGGSLFTIGSAPAPAPGASRAIKKLPTRRAGAKR